MVLQCDGVGGFSVMALQHDGVAGWYSNAMVLGVLPQWHSNTMVLQRDGAARCFDYLDIELAFRFLRIEDLSSSLSLGFFVAHYYLECGDDP
jgi:hypothetical protein